MTQHSSMRKYSLKFKQIGSPFEIWRLNPGTSGVSSKLHWLKWARFQSNSLIKWSCSAEKVLER